MVEHALLSFRAVRCLLCLDTLKDVSSKMLSLVEGSKLYLINRSGRLAAKNP